MQNCLAIKSNHALSNIEYAITKLITTNKIEFIYNEKFKKRGEVYNFLLLKTKEELPYNAIAGILSSWIINDFEEELVKDILNNDFTGFDESEKTKIINKVLEKTEFLYDFYDYRKIVKNITNCLYNNGIVSIEGILRFCITDHRYKLKFLICEAIEECNAEREYNALIKLMAEFVESGEPAIGLMHIKANPHGSFSFYDFAQKEIVVETNNKELLKEVFSEEDMVISILLTTMPKRIIWHNNSDNKYENLTNTIKEIFKDRFTFCCGCKLCNQ